MHQEAKGDLQPSDPTGREVQKKHGLKSLSESCWWPTAGGQETSLRESQNKAPLERILKIA